MFRDEVIAARAAQIYANSNWHNLSELEKKLIELLTQGDYLETRGCPNGYTGALAQKSKDILIEDGATV